MVCCLLNTPVFTHREHCCFPACVYILCVSSVYVSACVCTESSGSSGAALYPRLILIYVKAMAHWRACTMDWSAWGMCQRAVCVCVSEKWPRFGHASMVCLHAAISAPDIFNTNTHTHTPIHSIRPWGLTHLHTTARCGRTLRLHSMQSFSNSTRWHVLLNGLRAGRVASSVPVFWPITGRTWRTVLTDGSEMWSLNKDPPTITLFLW